MLTRPSTIRDAASQAVTAGRQHLLDLQHADGRWEGIVRSDPGVTAQFLLMMRYVDRADPAVEAPLLAHLERTMLPGGGWAAYPGGPAALDMSVLCYAALRFAGRSNDTDPMRRTREIILACGGIEATGFVPRFPLVFCGQIPPSGLTYISPKLLFMPRWIRPHLRDLGILLQGVLPVELLLKRRAARKPQGDSDLDELRSGRPHTPVRMTAVGAAISHVGRVIDILFPLHALDRRAADWLVEQQNADGLWAGLEVFTTRGVMALHAIDPARYRQAIDSGIAGMMRLRISEGETDWVQVGRSAVIDTAIAAAALLDGGVQPGDERLTRAVRWLLSTQADDGGWSYTEHNARTPDTDTTLHVLEVLARVPQIAPGIGAALARGTRWLLARQDQEGGWAMWPTDWRSGRRMVLEIDRAGVLDVSTPDVTARAVRALTRVREGVDAASRQQIDHAIARAVAYLRRTQRFDGSWPGRWAVSYTYGAAQGLTALAAAGAEGDVVTRARDFLTTTQQTDGGWGESPASDEARSFVSRPSTVTQTSLVLLAMQADRAGRAGAVDCGTEFLLDRERDGMWDDDTFCQTILPGQMYHQNSLFATSLAVMALARRASPEMTA